MMSMNDVDIEQGLLHAGFYNPEPCCPQCGADALVNRLGNVLQEAAVSRLAVRHGLTRRQVVTCHSCRTSYGRGMAVLR